MPPRQRRYTLGFPFTGHRRTHAHPLYLGHPNGRKVFPSCWPNWAWNTHVQPINILTGEQNTLAFRAINPNGKIPALVDSDGPDGQPISVFESAAIMIYLAEKHQRFLPASGAERYAVLQWLMFQMGGFGPMLGQAHHFYALPRTRPYAIERYRNEARRLYTVLDNQLAGRDYVAGDYSIADMALYPWATRHEWQEIDLADFPECRPLDDHAGGTAGGGEGMAEPG